MTATPGTYSVSHHQLEAHEVLLLLGCDTERGLDQHEADRRMSDLGPNVLPPHRQHGPVVRFLQQFDNPLIYVLLVAFGVTAALGEVVDAAVILGVVLVNAVVGFVQESRAGHALEALSALSTSSALVVRSGQPSRIESAGLVPGDLVVLEAGDKVPADLRLVRVSELGVDESSLTGESEPVIKHAVCLPAETALADRANMAYSSTLVTGGRARGVVVATGVSTEIGRIHQLVGEATGVETPLTRRLARFGRVLTVAILVLAAFTFVVGLVRGEPLADMVTASVALAVAAIPEGLPAAVTITLAIGVSRMARRRAIIRKLPAAEALGSVTVVCTDKTGTLTSNRMTVQVVYAASALSTLDDAPASEALTALLTAGALCNDTHVHVLDGAVTVSGDPTESALVSAAMHRGLDKRELDAIYPRVDEIPFSSANKWMATLHERPGGGRTVLVKGSAESVLRRCSTILGARGSEPLDRSVIDETVDELGAGALRVLAVARAELDGTASLADGPPEDLTLLGLQAMSDPLRPESVGAVASCRSAGIRVVMITGDHPRTASAVAVGVGLGNDPGVTPPRVTTGAELVDLDDRALVETVEHTDVFARVTAADKLRIVESLQEHGHVVAMTGDGVNDAPALKQADIGVAMGHSGTEVAKEASAMVLADDNFATIEAAVEEGRTIYDNLIKFVAWTLPTNVGEGLVVLAAVLAGTSLPMTPVQILWVNMTTAVALGLMLAFEPAEPGIMTRPPRAPSQPILTRALTRRVVAVGLLMLVGAFAVFEFGLAQGWSVEVARTVTVNTFVAMEIGYLFNCRTLHGTARSVGLFSNRWLLVGVTVTVVLQLALTYVPALQSAFGTASPPVEAWLLTIAAGVVIFGLVAAGSHAGRVRERRTSRR